MEYSDKHVCVGLHGAAVVLGIAPADENMVFPVEQYVEHVHPEDRQELVAVMERAVSGGKNHHADYRVIWPDGSFHWIEARGEMFFDELSISRVISPIGGIHPAVTGFTAVSVAGAGNPDIILMDIGLPGIDGYEAARRIRAQQQGSTSRSLLVAVTGWGQEKDRQLAFEAGFDQHWVKPITLEMLQGLL